MRITLACTRLSAAVEEMKTAGLPGNEAARLRQYSQLLMGQWEIVRNVKRYRTPLTTRCFGRLANLMHPFIMGPYCACLRTAASAQPLTHALRRRLHRRIRSFRGTGEHQLCLCSDVVGAYQHRAERPVQHSLRARGAAVAALASACTPHGAVTRRRTRFARAAWTRCACARTLLRSSGSCSCEPGGDRCSTTALTSPTGRSPASCKLS